MLFTPINLTTTLISSRSSLNSAPAITSLHPCPLCSVPNMERAHVSLSFSVYPKSSNLQNTQVTLFYTFFNSAQIWPPVFSAYPSSKNFLCYFFFSDFVLSFLSFLGYLRFRRQDSLAALAHRISNMAQPPQICLGKWVPVGRKGRLDSSYEGKYSKG